MEPAGSRRRVFSLPPRLPATITERLCEIGDNGFGVLEAWEVAQARRSVWEEGHGMVYA
jgi:hypothetical protein